MKKLKLILLCSFFLIGYVCYFVFFRDIRSVYLEDVSSMRGTVLSIQKKDDGLQLVVGGEEKVMVFFSGDIEIELGDTVFLKGTFKRPQENRMFYFFNYRKYLLSKRIYWIFDADEIIIEHKNRNFLYGVKNMIQKRIEGIHNPYLNTFLLGDNRIDSDVYESYQKNGISHLFAISGMHIALLSGVLSFFLKKIIHREWIRVFLISCFFLFFLFLTNFSASVIRSCFLFLLGSVTRLCHRKVSRLELLFWIAFLLLLWNPFFIYDIGFQYSFTISAFLMATSALFRFPSSYFGKLFMISFIAFLSSLPISVNQNFMISLFSCFFNCFFVPLVSFVLFPFSFLVFIFPCLNDIYFILISFFEGVSHWCTSISLFIPMPYFSFWKMLIYYGILLFLLFGFRRKKYYFGFVLFGFLFFHYHFSAFYFYPKVFFIDVGQGDASFIVLPYRLGNILIDTGGDGSPIAEEKLIPFFHAIGVRQIDYLILTHGDFDHMGEALSLVKQFPVRHVFLNSFSDNVLEQELLSYLEEKQIGFSKVSKMQFSIGDSIFSFLNDVHYEENADSLILYTQFLNGNILFMGDASKEEEKDILEAYKLGFVDILKVGHHGSKTSTSEAFLEAIRPKYGMISVAEHNLYGHPSGEVLHRLKRYQVETYSTSLHGSIEITFSKKIKIKTCLS